MWGMVDGDVVMIWWVVGAVGIYLILFDDCFYFWDQFVRQITGFYACQDLDFCWGFGFCCCLGFGIGFDGGRRIPEDDSYILIGF